VDAGLLSALGIGHAAIERFAERQILQPLAAGDGDTVARWIGELENEATAAVAAEGIDDPARIHVRRRIAHLRFAGQETSLAVEVDPAQGGSGLADAFVARYATVFGHLPGGRSIELESLRVVAAAENGEAADEDASPAATEKAASAAGAALAAPAPSPADAGSDGRRIPVPAFERADLAPETDYAGPALIRERHSAVVVEAGWTAAVDAASGALVLRDSGGAARPRGRQSTIGGAARRRCGKSCSRAGSGRSPPRWASGSARTASPPTSRSGWTSRARCSTPTARWSSTPRTSRSTSGPSDCASGAWVGALGPLAPGDVVVTNHPAHGGSHLPDVTVVTPAHAADGTLIGYVASRAHHAEIGGTRPGSMPPRATSLAEEGVVIPPTFLARRGEDRWDDLRRRLTDAPFPSRAPEDNLADLRAAVAANRHGAGALGTVGGNARRRNGAGADDALKARAERLLRGALAGLSGSISRRRSVWTTGARSA
jgi:5-oxoprolinase (ATP-hydrolysing)